MNIQACWKPATAADTTRWDQLTITSRAIAFASQKFPKLASRVLASSGYTLDLDSFDEGAFRLWDASTAERQDRAWQPLVAQAVAGNPRADIAALFAALDDLPATTESILEVGCGGGYNSELISHHRPGLRYSGVDIAPSMVMASQAKYPQREFSVASALELPFADGSFDAVMDGVALLHIPDWPDAIKEYARVARSTVILHGLTVSEVPTVTFAKYAYGQPSRELVFNRSQLKSEISLAGLSVVATHPGDDYDLQEFIGIPTVSETWVLGR